MVQAQDAGNRGVLCYDGLGREILFLLPEEALTMLSLLLEYAPTLLLLGSQDYHEHPDHRAGLARIRAAVDRRPEETQMLLLCTGQQGRQIQALVDEIEDQERVRVLKYGVTNKMPRGFIVLQLAQSQVSPILEDWLKHNQEIEAYAAYASSVQPPPTSSDNQEEA
jgi:LmbE family N-acetylglucosaminyl deacetylase